MPDPTADPPAGPPAGPGVSGPQPAAQPQSAPPPRGGFLARRGGGLAPIPKEKRAPAWRRFLVGLFVWLFGAGVIFAFASAAAALVIGWTGPPPTINMAVTASSGVDVRRTWAPLSRISPHLIRAVIAAEDQRFCSHQGFDTEEIRKALAEADRGRPLRGASTISQQTAKNVFLWNGGGFVRKGVEAWFTLLIEQMWSKPRIMEVYLNVAEWGDGLYGAEAAARARFKKSAKDLTAREAALLAAVLPSPNRWKITGRYVNRRAGQIQTLMRVTRRDDLDNCVIR
jgi:monofunctional glycosyltransferase